MSKQTKIIKEKKKVFNNADLLKKLIDFKDPNKVIVSPARIKEVKVKDTVQIDIRTVYDIEHKDFFINMKDFPQAYIMFAKVGIMKEIIEEISYEVDEGNNITMKSMEDFCIFCNVETCPHCNKDLDVCTNDDAESEICNLECKFREDYPEEVRNARRDKVG